MSFLNSAGVYERIVDRSFVVTGGGLLTGGIVISAKSGPLEPTYVTSARRFIELYGLPSQDNPSIYCALRFLNRAPALTVVRAILDATTAGGSLLNVATTDDIFTFTSANPGAWGNDVDISFASIPNAPAGVFALIVSYDGVEVERFEVSRDPTAKNGYGTNIFIEEVINNRSDYIRVEDNAAEPEAPDLTATVSLTGGADDTGAPLEADIISGYNDMENTNEVEAQLLINGGWATQAVQAAMLNVAENRKDAVAILDVPEATASSAQDMVDYRTDTLMANTYFGGIYGGWLRVYDQYNDREVSIPPSGDVAGAFVYTVSVAERWDAPAGLQRGIIPNALGVTKAFTEGERDLLYDAGVNPVTTYGGTAAVIWGQKTLQIQASALDRFNVVNSLLWMQERMKESLQPFVFEPNTAFTRDNVNYLLSSFLENIESRGGLYAFNVDTSTEINTPQVIDNNAMYVDVYVQPVRTAEFIRLSLIVTRTGVDLG